MASAKRYGDRKALLFIGKKAPKPVAELCQIRGDCVSIGEEFNTYKDADQTLKLMKKRKAPLFISASAGGIAMGRMYDGQFLELLSFRILKMMDASQFPSVAPEVSMKYAVLLMGVSDGRLANFFTDFFHQRTHSICPSGLRYAWIVSQNDKLIILKLVRIMNDLSVEDVGPYFELELENAFYCGDDLWKTALDVQKAKKIKNVEKNAFKDKIGRVYVDKQDLNDIKLKKSRGYKMKQEME